MIITATPLRVSLFGGGTDYPAWYREHGGCVVGMAIDKYVYLSAAWAPPGQERRYRITYSKIEDHDHLEDISHPGARGTLQHLGIDQPITIGYQGDLLARSGLGASSAYVVGLLQALRVLQTGRPNTYLSQLATEATYVERHVIGEAVGDQDQLFAAHGGLRSFELSTNRPVGDYGWRTAPIALAPELARDLESSLVLAYTGIARYAPEVAARVIEAIPARAPQLHRLQALAHEGRHALEFGALAEIGELLHRSWLLKRELHEGISPPTVDALYEHGLACGALGGKLLGAGGGGFLLFLVSPERRAGFEGRLGTPCVSFKVAPEGCRVVVNAP